MLFVLVYYCFLASLISILLPFFIAIMKASLNNFFISACSIFIDIVFFVERAFKFFEPIVIVFQRSRRGHNLPHKYYLVFIRTFFRYYTIAVFFHCFRVVCLHILYGGNRFHRFFAEVEIVFIFQYPIIYTCGKIFLSIFRCHESTLFGIGDITDLYEYARYYCLPRNI